MRLSVIIPGYNTPHEWWSRAVESVSRACEGIETEIICVDDGSDKKPIQSSFPMPSNVELKILRLSKNSGQAAARNEAIKLSSGRFITFVDSDDEVRPLTYKYCLDKLERTGADICLYGVTPVWMDERLLKHDVPKSKLEIINGRIEESGIPSAKQVEIWFKACLLNYVSNKVIRRSSLDVPLTSNYLCFDVEGMPCEDIIFYLELLISKTKWCTVDYDGYIYYRSINTSVSYYKACHINGIKKCAETWKRFCESRPEGFKYCGYHANPSHESMKSSERKNLLGKGSPLWYAKLYQLIRILFYIRPIRRWHLKKVFPNIEEY